MTKTRTLKLTPIAAAMIAALGVGNSFALEFDIGDLRGTLDSELSVGASWAMSSPASKLIDVGNGGTGQSSTDDDGRLNFKKGETFSKIFKGVHDLELKYQDSGAFFRGKYWYDFELKDESRPFKPIGESGRKMGAKSAGYDLLDAFVYHNYSIGPRNGHVRLGKQVVNWGESTFISGGLNSVNPYDVAAIRRPGAELKEGLLPVNMAFISQGLTDSLNLELFYQLKWEPYNLDNCGTFFGSDVAAPGCTTGYTVLEGSLQAFQPLASAYNSGFDATREGVILNRLKDNTARDDGQFGASIRLMTDNVEYGFFAMNYHSRIPFVSYKMADAAVFNAVSGNPMMTGNLMGDAASMLCGGNVTAACLNNPSVAGALDGLAAGVLMGNGRYFMDYPEDIRLYGVSFATNLPTGTAWSGEISYRPNAPIQLNTVDTTTSLVNPITGGTASPVAVNTNPGEFYKGYRRKEITQIQTTFIHLFDYVLGAEQMSLVGEIGFNHVGGVGSTSKIRYERDSAFGEYGYKGKTDGYLTSNSWGYRVYAGLDYSNVIAGINLSPSIALSHDVKGYGPGDVFNEGSKAVSVGLDADYGNRYKASINYTDFFGGKYNTSIDRDFLALSFGVNF